MSKIKYDKKEYSVRDSGCKKLINICFIPFSGNGQNICRRYELGQCPHLNSFDIVKEFKKAKANGIMWQENL